MKKPSNRQCEVARLLTKSNMSDGEITQELTSLTTEEWDMQCEMVDKMLIKHNMPFDKGWNIMCEDFINIATANGVNEATVFVAYMEWIQRSHESERS